MEYGPNKVQVCFLFCSDILLYLDFDTSRFDSAPSSTNSIRSLHSIRIATTGAEKKGFTVATVEKAAAEGEATVEEAAVEGEATLEEESTAAEQL